MTYTLPNYSNVKRVTFFEVLFIVVLVAVLYPALLSLALRAHDDDMLKIETPIVVEPFQN